MRARLMKEGKWWGRGGEGPSHAVPAQEEGEPPPKRLETDTEAPETPSTSHISETPPSSVTTHVSETQQTPDSLPPLEATPTAEGNHVLYNRLYNSCVG